MSAGLDPARVASSARVYVAAGTDGGFDAVAVEGGSVGRRARGRVEGHHLPGAIVAVDAAANAFTVRTGDLIAALGGAEKFAAGARVVVVYSAPLGRERQPRRGEGQPQPGRTCAIRARPFSDQGGEGGYTRTPSDDATAYTWGLALTKRASEDQSAALGRRAARYR